MLKWVFGIMIAISIICGVLSGNMASVSTAAINESTKAVELSIALLGSMCLWSGLLNVAKKSKLTQKIAKLLSPITKFIFTGINCSSYLFELICMNITANMLGLGNAATPLGIAAMKEMQKQEGDTASDNMIMFVVMNTASIGLIPTTVATLRLKYGANSPLDILPAVWLSSTVALTFGIALVKLCNSYHSKAERKKL